MFEHVLYTWEFLGYQKIYTLQILFYLSDLVILSGNLLSGSTSKVTLEILILYGFSGVVILDNARTTYLL